ncbi:hypothetical protein ABK046_43020 [Streptomyces caeruleatus]
MTCRERYDPWQTVYTRFRRYALDGFRGIATSYEKTATSYEASVSSAAPAPGPNTSAGAAAVAPRPARIGR